MSTQKCSFEDIMHRAYYLQNMMDNFVCDEVQTSTSLNEFYLCVNELNELKEMYHYEIIKQDLRMITNFLKLSTINFKMPEIFNEELSINNESNDKKTKKIEIYKERLEQYEKDYPELFV